MERIKTPKGYKRTYTGKVQKGDILYSLNGAWHEAYDCEVSSSVNSFIAVARHQIPIIK